MSAIIDFIFQPIVLFAILIPVILFLGLYVGTRITQPPKNRVIKVSPESNRGVELEVDREDSINNYCKPVGNIPPQRFIKLHEAINVVKKGWFRLTSYALWLGRYGTAYTQKISSEPVTIKFSEAVKSVFTDARYKQIPTSIKRRIESNQIGVTIQFPQNPLTPKGLGGEDLPSVNSDDIYQHDDQIILDGLARGIQQLNKSMGGFNLQTIFIMVSGVAVGIILSLIFKWGAPVIIQTPPTPINGAT